MENVENEDIVTNVSGYSQTQMVNRLLALMSQREKLDEEIKNLRAEINTSIAVSRSATVTPPPFEPVAEPEPQTSETKVVEPQTSETAPVTPPPFTPPTPQSEPVPVTNAPVVPPPIAEPEDNERKFGVKWMAIIGIFIAVLGLIICIKILLDYDLIGSVGRVILGYLASAAMVGATFKVPSERKVLKDTLIFGGATLAYAVTCTAYGYFDLFSSPVTLAVLFTITSAVLAFAYIKDNRWLFSYALMGFMFAPFCAGYSFDSHTNRSAFWMIFTLLVNIGLCFLYRIKKWSSAYVTSFVVTEFICIVKFFDGADFPHWVNVLYFASLSAVFYAGAVVLQLVKNNFKYKFLFITALNLSVFAIFSSIEFHNRHSVSYTFIIASALLSVTAFVFQKLLPEIKVLFSAPFVYALIFINLALLVNYGWWYSEWFALVYAVEILAAALVYWHTKSEFFKSLTYVLVYISFLLVMLFMPFRDFDYSLSDSFMIVLNPAFLGRLFYMAVLVFILRFITESAHKKGVSVLVYGGLLLTVVYEIIVYWLYVDSFHRDSVQRDLLMHLSYTWMLVLSVGAAVLPKQWDFLSVVKRMGSIMVLVSLLIYCYSFAENLSDLRSTRLSTPYPVWRYVSLALAIGALVFVIKSRKNQIFKHFDILSDLVAVFVVVCLVACELINLMPEGRKYGIWLSVWFGVASLISFLLGFKLQLKHLRVAGFYLAGQTVLKLFFYDIWNSELWVKAVVFVAVGVTFLLVSYFYSKYLKKNKDDGQTLGTE